MAFDAGAIIGTAKIEDKQWNASIDAMMNKTDKLEKTTKSGFSNIEKNQEKLGSKMFKSMFGAMTAYDLTIKAITGLINVGKRAINEYAKQEKAEKMLATSLGFVSKELLNQANQMQKLTGVADDAVIQGQAFLAQMGLQENQIKKLTPAVVDFAQAQGIGLSEAFKIVAKSTQEGANMLGRYGINIKEAGNQSQKVEAIVSKLNEKFGGQAQAIRGTWIGATQALDNATGDVLEVFGKLVTVVGKDIVESMIKGAESMSDFLQNENNMKKIASVIAGITATFQTLGEILSGVFKTAIDTVKEVFADLSQDFSELAGNASFSVDVLGILASVIGKALNVAIYVGVKAIGNFIQAFINLYTAAKETGLLVAEFFKSLVSGKWENVQEQAKKTGNAFKDMGSDFINNAKDMAKYTIDSFSDVAEDSKKMNNIIKTSYDKTYNAIMDKSDETTKKQLENNEKIITNGNKTGESLLDKFKNVADGVSGYVSQVTGMFNDLFSTLMSGLDNELAMLQYQNELKIEEMELQKENTLLLLEDEYIQKQAQLDADLENGVIKRSLYNTKTKELEQKKALDTVNITKQQDEKIAAEKKKNKQKENEAKKQAFEANKANTIANLWINFAMGLLGIWSTVWSIGNPIAAAVLGAVLSGALTILAGIQTGVVSQQQYVPEMATGGTVDGNRDVLINEKGGEIVTLPDGSVVVPNDISKQIANNIRDYQSSNNIVNINMSDITISNSMDLKLISDTIIQEIGHKLKFA